MLYFFSGTGNSKQVAQKLAAILNTQAIDICHTAAALEALKNENEAVGWVFPVYAWGIPKVVDEFIKKLPTINAQTYTYAVMTCGDDVGYTDRILERALQAKGWQLHAAFSVQMRNTYVCLPGFDIDSVEVESKKTTAAHKQIEQIADFIKNKSATTKLTRGSMAWLKTYVLRPAFNALLTTDRHFWVNTNLCTGCGLCAKQCPLGNMELDHTQHPRWKGHCTGCLRCYHICPKHAIEYGKFTRKKGQVKINV